ncbi:hypothetical protein F4820DRAFT_453701 [Hypoxylon rubiginosum]|uniref:Uncharacterized protein n=1 Tax=Hypoxylon rubiginosum TaxID=110542 RepID=A0ACB9YK75_9PEZI|nr:hypothetical protein F4820DRAFT_453701 [Hypoxylon rubiginosum]
MSFQLWLTVASPRAARNAESRVPHGGPIPLTSARSSRRESVSQSAGSLLLLGSRDDFRQDSCGKADTAYTVLLYYPVDDTADHKIDTFHNPSTVSRASQLIHHAPFHLWNFTLHFLVLTQHAIQVSAQYATTLAAPKSEAILD